MGSKTLLSCMLDVTERTLEVEGNVNLNLGILLE